jgi:tripartite-type tricarboxylate transporter receptor subunit TctC
VFRISIAALIISLWSGAYASQPFYAGKTVTIVTSTGPGGSYDLIARLVAIHMPSHIEGHPTIVVQNMPGAGHVLAANYMYNVAPKDGSTIATVDNIIPLHQVLDPRGVHYDASKFNWIGSTGAENAVAFAWRTSGIATVDDAKKREVLLGATGAGSSTIIFAALMNNLLGAHFKMITGYKSSNEVYLAIQKGEIESSSGSYAGLVTSYPDWLRDKKISILVQMGLTRDKRLSDVPLLSELATSQDARKIINLNSEPLALGQIYLAPPDVPRDRLEILRSAFAATLHDPAFLSDAAKARFEIDPTTGRDVARIVDDTTHTPSDILAKAKVAMTP